MRNWLTCGSQLTWKLRSPCIWVYKRETQESWGCDSAWSKGPRNRTDGVIPKPRAGEDWLSQLSSQAERVNSPVLHLFILFRSSVEWTMSTHTGEECLLGLGEVPPTETLISSRNPLTDTPRNNIWAGHPMGSQPTHKINHQEDSNFSIT